MPILHCDCETPVIPAGLEALMLTWDGTCRRCGRFVDVQAEETDNDDKLLEDE